jgi:tight adherence protein B
VDTVVREGNEPIAGEFKRALIEQRLGIEITDALEGVGERMESQDFAWVVMAIRIQREVGGNLAEILHTVSDTLREREYLRRQVKALSAEGRMSAWLLGALPVGMFGYMMMANREYVEPLYTTPLGWGFLVAAAFLLGLGSFMMAKMVKVEV